jgi:TRAP-type mannitol/chloroaromatic compound transport system permease small subunit
VAASWSYQEVSQEAGGLGALYLLKAVIPLAAALLTLQGLALGMRSLCTLLGVSPAGEADNKAEDSPS